jgi:hypothetical protein
MENRLTEAELEDRLNNATKQVRVGNTYKHYKGNKYEVIGIALLESNNEPCVIYRALYNPKLTYIRPVSVWLELVDFKGKQVERFSLEHK